MSPIYLSLTNTSIPNKKWKHKTLWKITYIIKSMFSLKIFFLNVSDLNGLLLIQKWEFLLHLQTFHPSFILETIKNIFATKSSLITSKMKRWIIQNIFQANNTKNQLNLGFTSELHSNISSFFLNKFTFILVSFFSTHFIQIGIKEISTT